MTEWFKRKRDANGKVIKGQEFPIEFKRRDTRKGFINYMMQNPEYFRDVFGEYATTQNIEAAFDGMKETMRTAEKMYIEESVNR